MTVTVVVRVGGIFSLSCVMSNSDLIGLRKTTLTASLAARMVDLTPDMGEVRRVSEERRRRVTGRDVGGVGVGAGVGE